MAESLINRVVKYKVAVIGFGIVVLGTLMVVIPPLAKAPDQVQRSLEVLGAGLLPAGVISLITEYLLRRDIMSQMSTLFVEYLGEHLEDLYFEHGQLNARVHEQNPTPEICAAFGEATKHIVLFNGWIPDFDGLHQGLRKAIQGGAKVRVLLANPRSTYLLTRAAEIGINDPKQQPSYVQINLDDICKFIDSINAGASVEVRLYDELLIAPVYATENEMYAGWFYKGRKAVTGPVVRVRGATSPLYTIMMESFTRVWNSSKTVVYYPFSAPQRAATTVAAPSTQAPREDATP